MSRTRIIFMGTPDYAVPALETLARNQAVSVDLVVTQPDRPQGRGRNLQSPPVKLAADRLRIPTLQVTSLKSVEARDRLAMNKPDLIVVAAFGIILGPKTLNLPRLGCVNLHASLLPAYRGANPIAAAIALGEAETGVTLMQMDRGLDTGPMLAHTIVAIDPCDTTETLTIRLAQSGAEMLGHDLDTLVNGSLPAIEQGAGASLTRLMTKSDGWIDWSKSAVEIERHIRAMSSWPRAWTKAADGSRIQIHRAQVDPAPDNAPPGAIVLSNTSASVATGEGSIVLESIQLPGGRPIEGRDIIERLRNFANSPLGMIDAPEPAPPLVVPV